MLNFLFQIKNPLNHKNNFKSLFEKSYKLSTNKVFELQLTRYSYYWLELELKTSFRGIDHAGPEICFGLFGYYIRINLYDTRHWDYINNTWEIK